ncbi:cytochrome c oxidase subunit II [Pedosphaera parvula]|uniref:Cytochrome c oxidase subunit 2 n=1 Tax=Pedosphaera parvula (strain Ellin514) TaxID=320771 RepID=B9XJX1_PEDPL|nr:cytochrome c oxidase subunit II [Pedosphaera parvula]EEF59794.1 cytochrome c oxidase, subunit II [Pedosphaera parvula Ellin514]
MEKTSIFHPNSPFARSTVDLLNVTFVISAVIMTLVCGLVAYCIWRFRGRPEHPEPHQLRGHKTLEIVWTVIPFLLLVYLLILTVRSMYASDPPRHNRDPDIIVTGHQFWWEARYPKSGVVTANEIHIPTGQPLLLRLESADVIHDFWVGQLGRKMDVMPDYANFIWIQANQPRDYYGVCAEFCGVQHAWMRIRVTAQSPEEFADWERQQLQPAPTPAGASAQRGAELFRQITCINCHAIRGLPGEPHAGPDLTHVATRQTLGAGVVENTPEHLAQWLKNPQKLKPGNLMPNMLLTDAQVQDMVSYFQTLK